MIKFGTQSVVSLSTIYTHYNMLNISLKTSRQGCLD